MATYTKLLSNNSQYQLELIVTQGTQSVNRWLTDLHVIEKFEENNVRGALFRDRRGGD